MDQEKGVKYAEDCCILSSQLIVTRETFQKVCQLLQYKKENQMRLMLHDAIKHIDEVEKTYKSKITQCSVQPR